MTDFFGFKPGCKVWLEKDGAVFGEGLYDLLSRIERTGSIAAAASEMGMSYRAAWGKIKVSEKKWQIRLVNTRVGGDTGGGASLTGEARMLLARFRELREGVNGLLIVHKFEK
ncbi:MAG: LysR family transcriptional regulator [Peptococcaceae bacterium]|nr:LysR family transcriptional regulator [Peptococcaceae bacterium]